jgi:nucleotide-binding universal stress UspA family protein
MFGGNREAEVTLFGVYEKIPRHDLEGDHPGMGKVRERLHALEISRIEGKERIEEAAKSLAEQGIDPSRIKVKYVELRDNVAKDILTEVREGEYGTVAIGRRGISNIREFFFGSVTSTLVSHLRECAVCVVE